MRKSWVKYGAKNREARRASQKRMYEANREVRLAKTKAWQQSPAGKASRRRKYLKAKAKAENQ